MGDALGWLVYGLWPWLQLCLAALRSSTKFRAGLRGAQGAFGMAVLEDAGEQAHDAQVIRGEARGTAMQKT